MAKKLKAGDEINGYRITDVFGPGAMAISYGAVNGAGQRVFFKQYKSPAVTVDWYRDYVRYQKELNRRIAESPARNYCVRAIDAFEAVWGGRNYFQVFEFVENGADLGGIFEREVAENGGRLLTVPFSTRLWEQHLIWAKVLMSGIDTLHKAKVAHADLKPDNAFLIEDPSIAAGFQLKLIDVDFSVLTDQTAPWHGKQGYVGTDNYRSPEHFTAGTTPGAASDVFTCGLILYQLLTGRHPYWSDDQAEYAKMALAHAAERPVLGGAVPAPASAETIAEVMHRCLAPRAADRPTAAEVRDVLTGRAGGIAAKTAPAPAAAPAPSAAPAPAVPAPPPPAPRAAQPAPAPPAPAAAGGDGAPIRSERMQLVGESGAVLTMGTRTPLGKHIVRQFGADFNVWDAEQCAVERGGDGVWQVVPVPGTTNETLLNGETLTGGRPLREGDVIAVGRAAKGIAKLPLTARAG
jgi:hypothetical protein